MSAINLDCMKTVDLIRPKYNRVICTASLTDQKKKKGLTGE